MADMPTIYPMRFPSIPANRTPSNIDDLLPSSYMDRPNPFTGAMQMIGKTLQNKRDDADQAVDASLRYGPNVAPAQIAALNDYLFRRGGQPYGGVMSPDGKAALQVPGAPEMTPFNTGGQVRAQTDAEQAAALQFKQDKAEEAAKLAHEKMDEQTRQFGERMKSSAAAQLETKANHDRVDARVRKLSAYRLELTAQKQNDFRLAQNYHRSATIAFNNANKARTLAQQKYKDLTNNFTSDAEAKAKENEAIAKLLTDADTYEQEGRKHSSDAVRLLDTVNIPVVPRVPPVVPQVPPDVPQVPPDNPKSNRVWFPKERFAGTAQESWVPADKDGVWVDTVNQKPLPY